MSLQGKLQRMKGYMNNEVPERSHRSGRPEPTSAGDFEKTDDRFPFSHEKLWKKYGFEPHFFDGEYSLIRKRSYKITNYHGNRRFSELKEVHEAWQGQKTEHPLSTKGVHIEDLLFFDTETTGLSSGAGTSIFLMGYSRIKGDYVEVVQHFMPGPASEAAFFHGFLSDFQPSNHLVSYNGKAFDWPHVKSRHAFVRNEVPKLPKFGHFDLLHAARRLWKYELPSCRLSIVESERLKIKRRNETPGSLAPILYFEYLEHKNPEELEGIFRHHEWDVLSLIVLFADISKRLLKIDDTHSSNIEHLQMGNWFAQVKDFGAACDHYEKAALTHGNTQSTAYLKLGMIYKKQKKFTEAKRFFERSIQSNTGLSSLRESYEELAKIMEHQDKDFEKALFFTGKAMNAELEAARVARHEQPKLCRLKKRMDRLEKKVAVQQERSEGR
ncbi:ribonuclease H-like domain-containing protein [Alteribacter populi]|uniref:ribonuclease H-like domain-containing protein n=1 Tax=Alteribacter populi TaxID=2011011 RepID=UPI0012FF9695|nr:ribonuclease H-like domain-containing protein [Alteribacter populi]